MVTTESYQEAYLKESGLELGRESLLKIFRFAFEEEMRRNLQKAQKEALTDQQAVEYFLPEHKVFMEKLI